MITKYTFYPKNNSSTMYCPFYKSTDYSKVLDDLIAADIAEKNPWLNGYNSSSTSCESCPLKTKIKIKIKDNSYNDLDNAFIFGNKGAEFDKACRFLSGLSYKGPFKKDVKYKLSNGDIIVVSDDYIHINDQIFYYDLMDNYFFNSLSDNMKKTIATIYVDGLKITIKK